MMAITEYIEFGQFNSKNEGFYLIERIADVPAEKVVVENLNYANGILDFSNITGERFYEQRTIVYTLERFNVSYDQRKLFENRFKRMLMQPVKQRLYDTHDRGYYWLGKCQSVKAFDDASINSLTLTIEFSLYPFAIKNNSDSTTFDDWDNFDFKNDFIQPFAYRVKGSMALELMNIGENSVSPTVMTDGMVTLFKDDMVYHFSPAQEKEYLFSLDPGINRIRLLGDATIRFVIQSEVLL